MPLHRSPLRAIATVTLVSVLAAACSGTTTTDSSSAPTPTATSPGDASPEPDQDDTLPPETTTSAPPASSDAETTNAPETTAPHQTSEAPPTTLPPTGIRPTRIEIPTIGVDTSIIDLDIRGALPEVPSDFDEVGWYEQTRKPGEIGPSVLAGHIDSTSGPAVFFRLDELVDGDQIVIHDVDGETRTFEVVDSGQYPKEALPDEVFGFGEPVSELRLITCGGTFDRNAGHYKDNVVVYTTEVRT